jgi:hypothetical protein
MSVLGRSAPTQRRFVVMTVPLTIRRYTKVHRITTAHLLPSPPGRLIRRTVVGSAAALAVALAGASWAADDAEARYSLSGGCDIHESFCGGGGGGGAPSGNGWGIPGGAGGGTGGGGGGTGGTGGASGGGGSNPGGGVPTTCTSTPTPEGELLECSPVSIGGPPSDPGLEAPPNDTGTDAEWLGRGTGGSRRRPLPERNPAYKDLTTEEVERRYHDEVKKNFAGDEWEKLHDELVARGCRVTTVRSVAEGGAEWVCPKPVPVAGRTPGPRAPLPDRELGLG